MYKIVGLFQGSRVSRISVEWLYWVSLFAGAITGALNNIHSINDGFPWIESVAFFAAAWKPFRFVINAVLLVGVFCLTHIIAIVWLGFKPPYVEQDVRSVAYCLLRLVPALGYGLYGLLVNRFSLLLWKGFHAI